MSGDGRLFVGTSGYAYKEWKGSFYPEGLANDRFLEYYASRFSSVEINSTFYRFPTKSVLDQWMAAVGDGFVFAIKAGQRITHRARLKNVAELTSSTAERIRYLGRHRGPVLFQLPPQLKRNDGRLEAFLKHLPDDGRFAVEFRDAGWFADETLVRLAHAGVALVQSEGDSFETPRVATAPFCYVRLRKDCYTERELADWKAWIDSRCAEGRDVFVYLKHDEAGTSPEPALRVLTGTT